MAAQKSFIQKTASFIVKLWRNTTMQSVYAMVCLFRFVFPPRKNHWAFPVHFNQGSFSDNVRPVFEEVKRDSSIAKIIFKREAEPVFDNAINTTVLNMLSFKGLWMLSQCDVIFVQHSLLRDFKLQSYVYRQCLLRRANIINLWHGIAVKYIQAIDNTSVALDENKHYKAIISSSKIDSLVMAASFCPATALKIQTTGLPRNDYLLKPITDLPHDYQQQVEAINAIKKNKKLILYAPTYREIKKGGDYYDFNQKEIETWKTLLKKHNAVVGLRTHYYKNSKVNYQLLIDNEYFFDLGQQVIADVNMIIRAADVVITDYSSLYIDAMYVDKPVVHFTYDLQHYAKTQRGFYYDLDLVIPGETCTTFETLVNITDMILAMPEKGKTEKYALLQKFFFNNTDISNAKRVVDFVQNEIIPH